MKECFSGKLPPLTQVCALAGCGKTFEAKKKNDRPPQRFCSQTCAQRGRVRGYKCKCQRCGKTGHFAKSCPTAPPARRMVEL